MALEFAGDFDIAAIEIVSKDVVVDVRNMMLELNLYEDLFSNGMTGNIMLSDAVNLPLYLPIVGEEVLNMVFNTPTDDNKSSGFNLEFPIIALDSRKQWKDRQQIFTLHCISEPQYNSSKTIISKSYKNKLHSEIVENIFEEYMNIFDNDEIFVEPTKYAETLVIPRSKPLEAINFIKSRSVSSKNTADYLFYETRDSYHFKSLNSLLTQNPVTTITNSPGGTGERFTLNRVLGWYYDKAFNMKQNIERGMLGSTLYTFDVDTKKLRTTTFDYNEDFENKDHLEKQKLIYDNNELADPLNRIFVKSVNETTKTDEWIKQRQGSFQVLNNYRVVVALPGNTKLNIGEIVNLNIFSPEQLDNSVDPQTDAHLSGKWLITSIRHKITVSEHIMILDLAKESYGDKLLLGNRAETQQRLSRGNFNIFN